MKIVEVFCGCGGFGALASTLGHEVVLGVDNDSIALDSWHKSEAAFAAVLQVFHRGSS